MKSMKLNKGLVGGDEVVANVGFSGGNPSLPIAEKEDVDQYPFCLRLNLDHEVLKALGMNSLPELGQTVSIEGKAKVVGAHLAEDGNKSLSIQITDFDLGSEESEEKQPEELLYRGV